MATRMIIPITIPAMAPPLIPVCVCISISHWFIYPICMENVTHVTVFSVMYTYSYAIVLIRNPKLYYSQMQI